MLADKEVKYEEVRVAVTGVGSKHECLGDMQGRREDRSHLPHHE
jgi:hypothetical protein